ncbi:STAS domain-containing protein [Nonomuraea candida]|uniref:STAS domain-containing protein n=1 Tax=Nonomuraea candida TaxID=359159 RepID=UPI001470869E|nr:STAS domain-containing protein [Nonomuraea candida]
MSAETEQGAIVVRLSGQLGWETVAGWRSWLEAQAGTEPRPPVLVDLSALTFLDSSGISSLVAAYQQVRRQGNAMAFLRPNALVMRWLRITGLHAHLPIFDSVQEALPAVLPPPED